MSRTGNCYDNAPMESFFSTVKCEHVHFQNYQTRQEAQTDIFAYIVGFYNRQRRHSSLGYVSPEEFERHYYINLS
jgi:putative transposase